jgi:hypothetical protein
MTYHVRRRDGGLAGDCWDTGSIETLGEASTLGGVVSLRAIKRPRDDEKKRREL